MAHPCSDDADLMTTGGQSRRDLCCYSSSSTANRRILIAEEQNFHLVTSASPKSCQPLAVAELAPEVEALVRNSRPMSSQLFLKELASARPEPLGTKPCSNRGAKSLLPVGR